MRREESFLTKKRLRAWGLIALVSLGLHWLMLIFGCALISESFSLHGLGEMIRDRLASPGDATRYLDIAQHGYVREGENAINLVFFPLYPLLTRILGIVTGNLALSAMVISQASYVGASILLYELILLDGDSRCAWDGVLILALYPFSMFVMGVFTEGLFLLLTVGCLYALRKRRFFLAGAVGFLAALTRIQGVLLLLPALCEWVFLRFGPKKRKIRIGDAGLMLIPAGFGVYLLINAVLHGNCFQFLKFEAGEPWYQTSRWISENIAVQYQMATSYEGLSTIIYWPQLALFFVSLLILALGLRRGERISDLVYGGAYLGFTYLSGWMISGGRYLLCCVPLWIILAKLPRGMGRRMLFFLLGLLFFSYSMFYLYGYAIM